MSLLKEAFKKNIKEDVQASQNKQMTPEEINQAKPYIKQNDLERLKNTQELRQLSDMPSSVVKYLMVKGMNDPVSWENFVKKYGLKPVYDGEDVVDHLENEGMI